MKKLKHITLGKLGCEDILVSDVLMKELSSYNSLRTLSLIQIKGNIKQVNCIISNNPHLNTIIII